MREVNNLKKPEKQIPVCPFSFFLRWNVSFWMPTDICASFHAFSRSKHCLHWSSHNTYPAQIHFENALLSWFGNKITWCITKHIFHRLFSLLGGILEYLLFTMKYVWKVKFLFVASYQIWRCSCTNSVQRSK